MTNAVVATCPTCGNQTQDFPWMVFAKAHIGLTEITGAKHNETIIEWLVRLNAWWRNDEEPWCGVLPAMAFIEAGLPKHPKWYRAREWLNFGVVLDQPVYGCLVILRRNGGGGHVAFAHSLTEDGHIRCLGANQDNAINIKPFHKDRVLGYRFPTGWEVPKQSLPVVVNLTDRLSTNEA